MSDEGDQEGLGWARTQDLEELLKALESGKLSVPFDERALTRAMLPLRFASFFEAFGQSAMCITLRAVLSERLFCPKLSLVWSGPQETGSSARCTYAVMRDLLQSAKDSVLVAGYSFDGGKTLFADLSENMRLRSLDCNLFVDVKRLEDRSASEERVRDHARAELTLFLESNWPTGGDRPDIYYDPRSAGGEIYASMHAKCIIIDSKRALVGSANFTNRGQHRNIEMGVLIDDPQTCSDMQGQWLGLIRQGLVEKF